jgi:hypothetical protein
MLIMSPGTTAQAIAQARGRDGVDAVPLMRTGKRAFESEHIGSPIVQDSQP